VNQEEFSRRLRDAACVAHIRLRHGAPAAAVVAAMLRRPPGSEQPPFQVRKLLIQEHRLITLKDVMAPCLLLTADVHRQA